MRPNIKTLSICLISQEYPPETGNGGIGTYTYHLAHGLSSLGHNVTVLSSARDKETVYSDKKVKIYRFFDIKVPIRGTTRIANLLTNQYFGHWWHSKSVFQKLKEIQKTEQFDIIEAPLWAGETVAFDNSLKVPIVIRLQTPYFKYQQILSQLPKKSIQNLEKKVLNHATLIASISHAISDLIVKHYKINKQKIRYSPLGIDYPNLKTPIFHKNSHNLLYVSRLEQRKGTQEFIEALPEILKIQNISVDIIGKDIAQAPGKKSYFEYFKQIVPLNLQNKVKFHGFVEDQKLAYFYKNCDLFIMPSRYESFGLVYLEAMAYGKPVIGTKIGGIPEIVNDKVGILVEVNSPSQIANAVNEIFSDEKLRQKLGQQAFSHSRQNFSVAQMVNTTLKLYNEAIERYK